jgi:AcrR family transcriptional regulator
MSTRPYRPPRRSSPPPSRGRILAAVRELLAEGAFHAATVEDVADRAGVSRATVYQQFGSRFGLLDAICETIADNPSLVAIRAAVDEGTAAEALDAVLGHAVAFWASEEDVLLQLYGVAAVDPAAADFVARQRADRRREMERLLRRLEPADERVALARLLLLTSFETYVELRRHAGLSEDAVVGTLRTDARELLL